jgi:hypothetical protein
VVVRSKTWDCVRSLVGIAGLNHAEGMDHFGVCCLVEVSATDRSLVRRSLTERDGSECDFETSATRRSGPTRAVEP